MSMSSTDIILPFKCLGLEIYIYILNKLLYFSNDTLKWSKLTLKTF